MPAPPEVSPLLDDIARRLLDELQSNGRASYAIPSIAGRMVLRSRRESPHQPPRE